MKVKNEMKDIKYLRKLVKVKQFILAEELGIEQSNYSNIENGKLVTSKINEIKANAVKILLPILEKQINIKYSEIYEMKKLQQKFK